MSEKAEQVTLVGKAYLGDGAYVAFDGYALVLTTENGIETTNTVVLEPDVYAALVAYVERLKAAKGDGPVVPNVKPENHVKGPGHDDIDALGGG